MTAAPSFRPPLNQVAFPVVDLRLTEQWFRAGLGFLCAGGSRLMMSGPLAALVQGLPGAASTCGRRVGRNPWFQFELFQCRRPVARLMPDGVFVERMEDDPLPQSPGTEREGCGAALRSVTLSTPDLVSCAASFEAVCARAPSAPSAPCAERVARLGLDGARAEAMVFDGGDVRLELVQYLDPPASPRPDGCRIGDQGILHVARAIAAGARPNFRPGDLPGAGVVYVNDAQGFSVERLWRARWADMAWGFVPRPPHERPPADERRVQASVQTDAPLDGVWAVPNDTHRMGYGIGFPQVRVHRETLTPPGGRGSERWMRGPAGSGVERVVEVQPKSHIRCRVVEGSPFVSHQGGIAVAAQGTRTCVTWTIRFRSRLPLLGGPWPALQQRMLDAMLRKGLKRHVEDAARAGASRATGHRAGQVASVNGGASGFGLAAARALATQGADVVIVNRGAPAAAAAVREIEAARRAPRQPVASVLPGVAERTQVQDRFATAVHGAGTAGPAAERERSHPGAPALKALGGTMSTQAAVCAPMRGIERRRFLIVPGLRSKRLHGLSRVALHGWWNAVADALVAPALRRQERA